MKKEKAVFLNQLLKSLVQTEKVLESSYENQDLEKFNKSKKMLIEINRRIWEVIK